ncbi:hypothetical protein [Sporomusa sp.]|uniref:hypothetical protein n=1 Tax=Sporomusa sp. TaxID=2078658 RepID=UPI002BC5DCE4|nr:hypothetical protein [Sporomusa sp.]HWR42969.1 hypothetical protein [Sporomusa sp.]
MYHLDGTIAIINSTISNNKAGSGGAIMSDNGTIKISFSTIVKNQVQNAGASIYNRGASVAFKNSIVAKNDGPNYAGSYIQIHQ